MRSSLVALACAVTFACTLLLAAPAAAQNGASISVGDEVVFSGGPGAPPQSRQTGFTMEVGSIRGSGGGDVAPATGARKAGKAGKEGGSTAATGAAGNFPGLPGAPSATLSGDRQLPDPNAEVAEVAPAPPPPPDYAKFSTDDLTAALGEREPTHRQAAVAALARRDAAADRGTVRSALESALADAEPRVVQQAAEALGQLGDTASAPAVMRMVFDRDDGVAIASIKAITKLGHKAAVPELAKLADRDLGPVGSAARAAVLELSRPPRAVAIDPKTQPVPKVP